MGIGRRLVWMVALLAPTWAAAVPADMVLFNGKVLTVDAAFSIEKAVAIKDGKIIAVGGDEIARRYEAPVRIDLKGRTLMPGFMDNHLHPRTRSPRAVELMNAQSIAEIQALVRAKAAQLGPGEWISGFGWAETNLAEHRNVLRADLDAAAPNNPVALARAGGHSIVGNSLALKAAGITRDTANPLRGVIERDTNGEPNGIIRERTDLYTKLMPKDTPDVLRPGYVEGLKGLTSLGLTSIVIAAASIRDEVNEKRRPEEPEFDLTFKQLRSIYAEHGEYLPRAAVEIGYPGAEALAAYPHKTGYGDDRLRLGAIGEAPAVDGGFSGPTAWTTHAYKGKPGFFGQAFFENEADLQQLADDVAKNGWQLGLHAIGDAAINMAAKVYAQALHKYPRPDPRWYLAHFTMRPTDATLDLMAREKILAAAQPNFLYTLEERYLQTLEGADLQHNNPVAVPVKHGVFVTFGSDNLPIDPRVGLYAAVTRRGISGAQYGPDEAVSIRDAIRMYTANPPYLTWEEKKKGTLEVGKFADMIVLDVDPLTIEPQKLLTMNVDMTVIGGKIVYRREPSSARQSADLLLHNGKIITVDERFSIQSAVAVKDGRILAVGGEELRDAYDAATVIDLKGRVLLPGFMDTHIHVQSKSPRAIDLESAKSIADVQRMLREKAAQLGAGQWITGYGWDEALLAEKRNIVRADLDAGAPRNPVVLTRAGSHSVVGNSLALKIAKLGRDTPDPKDGLIERDASGEPNGIIRERNDLFYTHVPEDKWQDLRAGYVATLQRLFSLGITSIIEATGSIDDEPVGKGGVKNPGPRLTFQRMQALAKEYDLPRTALYIGYPGAERLRAFPHKTGYGDERVRLGPIGESPVDGGFTGPTAWTLVDYKGMPGFRGKGRYTDAELQEMVDTCARLGWQVGLHAIGDAAIVQTVNAYSKSLRGIVGAQTDHRWFLDHFTIMPPDATMQTMAADGIRIAQQPNFLYNLEGRYTALLDDWRLRHNNSVGTPAKKFGLFVAFGSDNLPIGPMVGLYAAVTRKGPSGIVHGPEESVSVPEAIRMYTANGPYLTFEEKLKGTLEPGKLADMIVLDADPLTIGAEQLRETKVDLTILGGKVVYDRSRGVVAHE